MYLDVDTKVVTEVQLEDAIGKSGEYTLSMVRHPGYFNNSILKFLIARGPNGTWETSPRSKAFVPFSRRRVYVAGGVWLGTKKAIQEMVKNLRKNVQDDLDKGIVAKWHDESHLNYWSTRTKVKYLTPAWAYAPGYSNISSHDPIIELIHKDETYFEQRD
jgi:hypothetical protein